LTGGTGLLGTELRKIASNYDVVFDSPTSQECNILDYNSVMGRVEATEGQTVLHCAAFTDVSAAEKDALEACELNIRGTLNVLAACRKHNKKMVFISTDYVFGGNEGGYTEKSPMNPVNNYALTKGSAELAVRTYKNSLVIRTSFCPTQFPYEKAFTDQYTSRDYVDIIAPKILEATKSEAAGVMHIGTERKSVYELASRRNPEVGRISTREVGLSLPRDTSFKIN